VGALPPQRTPLLRRPALVMRQPATPGRALVPPASATRCVRLHGALAGALRDAAPKRALSLACLADARCSFAQVDRWNEQRENGNWPGRY
jgi:hypothetical protein